MLFLSYVKLHLTVSTFVILNKEADPRVISKMLLLKKKMKIFQTENLFISENLVVKFLF